MNRARNQIYRDFLSVVRPKLNDRILDVGVSEVIGEGANLIERLFPRPQCITAVGLSDGYDFIAAFPRISYRRVEPNTPLPFAKGAFDIACANAVLEHIGSLERQQVSVADLLRVARRVSVTLPYRFFPIELSHGTPLRRLDRCHLRDRLPRDWQDGLGGTAEPHPDVAAATGSQLPARAAGPYRLHRAAARPIQFQPVVVFA